MVSGHARGGWRRGVYLAAMGACAVPVVALSVPLLVWIASLGLVGWIAGAGKPRGLLPSYAEQGRVISREEAWARVRAGRGTFLAYVTGWGLQSLWWVEADRGQLDPEEQTPIATNAHCCASEEFYRRVEPYVVRAMKVEGMGKWEFELLDEVPTVRIDVGMNEAGLTGREWVDGALERVRALLSRGEDGSESRKAK